MTEQFLSSNRIIGELPEYLTLNGIQIKIPKALSNTSQTISLSKEKGVVNSIFIHKTIGHILNSERLEDRGVRIGELKRALEAFDQTVSGFIKDSILKRPYHTSFVAFSQTSENVGTDELLISEETFNALVGENSAWSKCHSVIVTRYPNLGPNTTISLRLVVDKNPAPVNSVLSDMLSGLKLNESSPRIGCVYLNQSILKDCLEGDADGDMIFMIFEKRGQPLFREVDLSRKQGIINEDDLKTLLRKSKVNRTKDPVEYLASRIDQVPIGKTTYAIRWKLFFRATKYSMEYQPLHKAWKEISPWAIKKVEFAMDIRKGDFTEEEINQNMKAINKISSEISVNKLQGNWFAQTVTSSSIRDVKGFLKRFTTAQEFVNYCQKLQ